MADKQAVDALLVQVTGLTFRVEELERAIAAIPVRAVVEQSKTPKPYNCDCCGKATASLRSARCPMAFHQPDVSRCDPGVLSLCSDCTTCKSHGPPVKTHTMRGGQVTRCKKCMASCVIAMHSGDVDECCGALGPDGVGWHLCALCFDCSKPTPRKPAKVCKCCREDCRTSCITHGWHVCAACTNCPIHEGAKEPAKDRERDRDEKK
jgi:hypothetical protein